MKDRLNSRVIKKEKSEKNKEFIGGHHIKDREDTNTFSSFSKLEHLNNVINEQYHATNVEQKYKDANKQKQEVGIEFTVYRRKYVQMICRHIWTLQVKQPFTNKNKIPICFSAYNNLKETSKLVSAVYIRLEYDQYPQKWDGAFKWAKA